MKTSELFGPSLAMQTLINELHDATLRYRALKTPEALKALQKVERKILSELNRNLKKK